MRINCRRAPFIWMVGILLLLVMVSSCDTTPPSPTLDAPTLTPTTALPSAPVATAAQQVVASVPEATRTATLLVADATVPVESIVQLEKSEEQLVAEDEDRDTFRPIATADSAEISPPTPTTSLTTVITPTQQATGDTVVRTTLSNRRNAGEVSQTLLFNQIVKTQAELRTLSFLVNEANVSDTLNCTRFVKAYERIANDSPIFIVSEIHTLPYFYYNRAVEDGMHHFEPLNQFCEAHIAQASTDSSAVAVDTITPQAAYLEAVAHHQKIMTSANHAVLWINADDSVTFELYEQTRHTLGELRNVIGNNPTTTECNEISDNYADIGRSPRFAPAMDTYRYVAYRWYVDAVTRSAESADGLTQHCTNYLATIQTDDAPTATPMPNSGNPLPADEVESALSGLRDSLTFINNAIRLRPTQTPEPTAIPIQAEVLRVQEGQRDYLYEIVVQVIDFTGAPPVRALIGGFIMQPDNTITIVHTCQLDFIDHIVLVDSNEQLYISQKLRAERAPHCFTE